MLNLGEVDIRGIDVAGTVHLPLKGLSLRGQYTFQRAIDVTDASRPFYRHQIPYIPRHAGSAIVQFNHKRLSLNYSFIYTGERWNAQVNNEYNHMQPWYTHDLAANYTLPLKKGQMKLTLEVNNIFNQQYDVIANYPMPGRHAYMGVELEL
jgi:outer membrane receptor protein involved in Fe transport